MPTSLFNIFKIGIGPSSSHTVGPMKAARSFLLTMKHKGLFHPSNISYIKTELYGSLALTGRGHGTDKAIILGLMGEIPEKVLVDKITEKLEILKDTQKMKLLNEIEVPFNPKDHLIFYRTKRLAYHTNGMKFRAFFNSQEIFTQIYYSIGGGFIKSEEEILSGNKEDSEVKIPYNFKTAVEMISLCEKNKITIAQMVMENEKAYRSESEI